MESADIGQWIAPMLALLVAIGGTWWVQRSSGAREITEATRALLTPMTNRIESVEAHLSEAKEELSSAHQQIRLAHRHIEDNSVLLRQTQRELEEERAERAEDRRRLTALERWARVLYDQVIELGGTPVPFEDFHRSI